MLRYPYFSSLFFFNDTATTEIYTLSLHDALPIYKGMERVFAHSPHMPASAIPKITQTLPRSSRRPPIPRALPNPTRKVDRKSTRLNSSHGYISYAVFCLKKKNNT